jgi:F0F1-type ATP synthase membrane subunit c/vacuolar-type H+-ATPase subunit K
MTNRFQDFLSNATCTTTTRSLDDAAHVKAAEAKALGREGLAAQRDALHARNVDARRRKYAEAEAAAAAAAAAGAGVGAQAAGAARADGKGGAAGAESLTRDPKLPSATAVWEPLQARANHGGAVHVERIKTHVQSAYGPSA